MNVAPAPLFDRAAEPGAVTAVLGPTNTGKTHFAIERMLAHSSGVIGLPLRLLAREVYNRVVEKIGPADVALVTGEEKIKPKNPRYWISTVEAMPRDLDVAFVAVDEIQLAANLDRGHVFTDRLLHRRGREETLIIGASTMRQAVEGLLPKATIVSRPRLSKLTFAGERKLSRLPRRTAIVAFSAEEVYAIAELIRRQRGGAAVVLGALSPRTRNAQIEMYQNGDVEYIVATDAIGMGLNLDVDHIAFASDRKFDGWQFRRLTYSEFGQIAGRAGRHVRDGTFGTTGRCPPFDEDLVEALEDHRFDAIGMLQWRNTALDFSTIAALQRTLETQPETQGLTRAPLAEDVLVLDIAARDADVTRATKTGADVRRLWDACQIPDYRKLSPSAHAELVLTVYGFIVRNGRIPDDWFARQLAQFDRTDGEIDTLSARIAQVRVGKPLRWPLGCEPDSLVHRAVGEVTRRGKYLWVALDGGGLLMHLGMSGSLAFSGASAPSAAPGPHDHFDLVTERGTLRLTDPRRFGAVVWSEGIDAGPAAKLLAGLGLEPFDPEFNGAHLHAAHALALHPPGLRPRRRDQRGRRAQGAGEAARDAP